MNFNTQVGTSIIFTHLIFLSVPTLLFPKAIYLCIYTHTKVMQVCRYLRNPCPIYIQVPISKLSEQVHKKLQYLKKQCYRKVIGTYRLRKTISSGTIYISQKFNIPTSYQLYHCIEYLENTNKFVQVLNVGKFLFGVCVFRFLKLSNTCIIHLLVAYTYIRIFKVQVLGHIGRYLLQTIISRQVYIIYINRYKFILATQNLKISFAFYNE